MKKINNLAFDLGASSGRLIQSSFDGEKIEIKEVRRFPNEPVRVNGRFYWDIFRLFYHMKLGLREAAGEGGEIRGIGIDTWGVDYGLLDKKGNVIGLPMHYRDSRNDGGVEKAEKKIPLRNIYNSTGIQFMDFNTLFQLCADRETRPDIYDNAQGLLFIPDLLNFFLTGEKRIEYTNASTSQMLRADTKDWDRELIKAMGLRTDMFYPMIQAGTPLAPITGEIMEETGLKKLDVIAVGSHDTASAVAGTPFYDHNAAFLSCGTWSLLGMETDSPIRSSLAFQHNFTNEGGVMSKIRFLKNINGLWIIQQLRKSYNEDNPGKALGFGDIVNMARAAANKSYSINPRDPSFTAPLHMYKAVRDYIYNKYGKAPQGIGEAAMAFYNGVTAEYAAVLKALEETTGQTVSVINMIGGGIQDELLCQMTADVTGKTIIAGPVEGSVLGNIVMQLIAAGEIGSLEEGRRVIQNSFAQKTYLPANKA